MDNSIDNSRWPYAETLHGTSISARVDFAKMALHSSILSSSNPDEIFVEDILNIFISLVQHPINFAFFDEQKRCLFHFCKDPIHQDPFESYIEGITNSDRDIFFDFFNYDKKTPKKYLSIIYMDTKNNQRYIPIEKIHFDIGLKNPITEKEYISVCANMFFETRWNSFNSFSVSKFLVALEKSIAELTKNESLKKQNNPDLRGIDKDDLLDRLATTLAGIGKSTSYVSQLAYDTRGTKRSINTPETMLTFRDYSVKNGYSRYNDKYDYKTRFVGPNLKSSISRFVVILKDMQKKYPLDESIGPMSCIQIYAKEKTPYSSIRVRGRKNNAITRELDMRFWKILHSSNGIKEILGNILKTPVSKQARSLVDPVYQTGLIHYNRIFENAGLDRIDKDSVKKIVSKNYLSIKSDRTHLEKDLLRIVVLYYLISYVLEKEGHSLRTPEDIMCVMFPVKIKGVCWAIAIQAYSVRRTQLDLVTDTYDTLQHRHGEQHEWLSRFLLTTAFRKRLFSLIDSTCWEYAQHYVIDSVVGSLNELTSFQYDAKVVQERLNEKMVKISSYLPYGFPRFIIGVLGHRDFDECDGQVSLNPHGGKVSLGWIKSDNPFYKSTHKWTKKSTRSFRGAINLGVRLANDNVKP